jgi:cysteinyl-tRNA synthetase
MRLYDSLRQGKNDFVPRDGDHVTMYVCGPTVYNYVHLGNARPYVLSLVAKRYFESQGLGVTLVENITDIDDRIINKAAAEGRTWREVAEEFAGAYVEDTDRLGLGRPDVEPYATEHIAEIIELIEGLIGAGHAYVADGDVYFDVDSYPPYGKLSRQQIAEMRHGARITPGEVKDDPLDFALWKAAKPGEPQWDSPWGPGRPGWHIECSAMSLKYLGPGFDIHGGGRDLIFPHHENEIAQAEGAGRDFARFWMHNGMLNTREEKMSKSIGNIFLLREALKLYKPEALICFFLSSHYRSSIEFSHESLDESTQQVERLKNLFRAMEDYLGAAAGGTSGDTDTAVDRDATDVALTEVMASHRDEFNEALADDLNTAAALATVFAAARVVNAALDEGRVSADTIEKTREGLLTMAHILGLNAVAEAQREVPADVLLMAADRRRMRLERNFVEADRLRDEILARGYEVRDTAGGFKVIEAE